MIIENKKNQQILRTALSSLVWCFLLFFYNIGPGYVSNFWTIENYMEYLLEFGSILWILSNFDEISHLHRRRYIVIRYAIVVIGLSVNYVIMVLSRTKWYLFLMMLGSNVIIAFFYKRLEAKLKISHEYKDIRASTFKFSERILIVSLIGLSLIIAILFVGFIDLNEISNYLFYSILFINMIFALYLFKIFTKKRNTTLKIRFGILIISIYGILLIFILNQFYNLNIAHFFSFPSFYIGYGTDFFFSGMMSSLMQILIICFILAYIYLLFRLVEHIDLHFSSICYRKKFQQELLENKIICPFCYELVSFKQEDKKIIQSQGYLICNHCKSKILKFQIENLNEKELYSQHDNLMKSLKEL